MLGAPCWVLRTRWRLALLGAASLALLGASCGAGTPPAPRFLVEQEWVGRGTWIAADLHTHTRFSDGADTVAAIIEQVRANSCQAVAITDHADGGLKAATPEYQAAIEAARASNPDTVILAGLEWNVPPSGGDEHATLLVSPGDGEWTTLAEFKAQFDDYDLGERPKPDAAAALRWLNGQSSPGLEPLVIYNHPSRKDAASMDNVADLEAWRAVNDVVIGFEGAPGHQGDRELGSYNFAEKTVDRWDPVAARIGDAWDTLLQRGFDLHGALAGSDFHATRGLNDYWPCQFSETWLYVPERSASGLLHAVRAGAFFGAHGHIAREVELEAALEGLPRPARAGETVEAPAGSTVTVTLRFTVPERDWQGQPNRVDAVEFILITPEEVRVLSKDVTGTGPQGVSEVIGTGDRGFVVRARGRRVIEGGPDLMFYTNAIRVTRRGGL